MNCDSAITRSHYSVAIPSIYTPPAIAIARNFHYKIPLCSCSWLWMRSIFPHWLSMSSSDDNFFRNKNKPRWEHKENNAAINSRGKMHGDSARRGRFMGYLWASTDDGKIDFRKTFHFIGFSLPLWSQTVDWRCHIHLTASYACLKLKFMHHQEEHKAGNENAISWCHVCDKECLVIDGSASGRCVLW